ncbi:hypothetical protein DYI37_03880 [Fulvimarina endophytica]|uniref:Phage portal protein n=1 Tax=Fulvimarina endophytica TaxID=2293836 RepID=A0A371X703_9HYPH|nr:hypothetical protein [Fulvimarina endophytica]RFC65015.1 hypothetical protein DYI37_03880 [Fulvimarina endophytica]
MPTFLDLARKVGSESGTVAGSQITTVENTNDRIGKIVRWTNDAYRQIQNANRDWGWLRDVLLDGTIVAGKAQYDAPSLGITRFREWECTGDDREDRFHLLDPSTGQASRLRFMDYRAYLSLLGTSLGGDRPHSFTISPRGAIILHPRPTRAFLFRAPYRLAPQELVSNADVPDMPAHHHDVIVETALVLLATHDEAAPTLALYQLRQLRGFSQLEREQLPVIRVAEGFC